MQFKLISNLSLKHIDLIVSKQVSVASNEINSFGTLVLEFSSKYQCEKFKTSYNALLYSATKIFL